MIFVPFMSQMAAAPEVCRQRMSALPSPLKSPTRSMVQSVVMVPGMATPATAVPSMSQMATEPEVCRQRRSALASPLKSPTPTMVQSVDSADDGRADDTGAVHEPDGDGAGGVRQRMSEWPSPLKSRSTDRELAVTARPKGSLIPV